MTNATHDRMHELLCAYVLGEATADERAEVERALANSPELAREKERIEATIGLVQGAMGKDETLSDARREEVLRAVVPPSARPWWKETWVRAAAGILFVSFALGGWSVYEQRQRADECAVTQNELADDALAYGEPGAGNARRFGGVERDQDQDARQTGGSDEHRKAPRGATAERGGFTDAARNKDLAEVTATSVDHDGESKSKEALGFLGGMPATKSEDQPAAAKGESNARGLASSEAPSEGLGRNLGLDAGALASKPGEAGSRPIDRLSIDATTGGAQPSSDPSESTKLLFAGQPGGGGGGAAATSSSFPVVTGASMNTLGPGNPFEKLDAAGGSGAGGEARTTRFQAPQTPSGPSTGGPGASLASAGVPGGSAPEPKLAEPFFYKRGDAGRPGAAGAPGEKSNPAAPRGEVRMRAAGDDANSLRVGRVEPLQQQIEAKKQRELADKTRVTELSAATKDEQLAMVGKGIAGNTESELVESDNEATREQWLRTFQELDSLNVLQEDELVFNDLKRWAAVSERKPYEFGAQAGGGSLVAVDGKAVELSDEDRFILTQLGLQPGQELPTITLELRLKYRDAYVDHWCQRIHRHCERRPDETPRDMFFRFWGDNPFELSALDPLSTFSADVDTASYALARRYIREGKIPEKAQVRTEEFVNAFKADVPPPTQGTFAITTTLAPSRYGAANPGEPATSARDLLRVVIRGKDVAKTERKPLALTFVVDVSGSMKEQNRIEMVKHAMRLLVSQLDARDSIAIVKFSTDAAMVLPMTSAKNKDQIETAIFPLAAEGSTNSEAGLRMGYATAITGLNVEATNRVVFLSDGVANVGVTDPNVISEGVKQLREKGIYLNTIGVGMNNHNDVLLEQLADKGDGVCNYVDGPDEAKKVFVDQFMGTVETIARDVKLQVEFDPAQVFRYRLLGYENRAIADADFRNDKVDAGEVGAGHQVTALYEIEYATPSQASEKPLATVRVRYKAPRNPNAPTANEEATELAQTVTLAQRTSWEGAGPGYRKAAIVGQFAEFLRRSIHARNDSFDQLIADAKKLESETKDAEFSEFVTLLDQSKALILNGWPNRDELALAVDQIRENYVLRTQFERLATEHDRQFLAELEKSNRELEARLREMLRHRLEQPR